jgi:hypothetical protein
MRYQVPTSSQWRARNSIFIFFYFAWPVRTKTAGHKNVCLMLLLSVSNTFTVKQTTEHHQKNRQDSQVQCRCVRRRAASPNVSIHLMGAEIEFHILKASQMILICRHESQTLTLSTNCIKIKIKLTR